MHVCAYVCRQGTSACVSTCVMWIQAEVDASMRECMCAGRDKCMYDHMCKGDTNVCECVCADREYMCECVCVCRQGIHLWVWVQVCVLRS